MSARHDRVSEIFLDVCDREPGQRDARLQVLCGSDLALRREVELLLQHDETRDAGSDVRTLDVASAGTANTPVATPGRIGPYEITGTLGEGGMGIVYDARQPHPQREIALKVLRPSACSATTHERFRREAEILGRLAHPGIAQVFEAGIASTSAGPVPYLAMEKVAGTPLLAFCRQARLTLRQRLRLFVETCDAVHHAHQRGVIHRDLKPANILALRDASAAVRTKVLDFGVSYLTDADARLTISQDRSGLLGTLAYMAPEQLSGQAPPDIRLDVHALGVLLFELLTDAHPYDIHGRGLADALHILRTQEPRSATQFDPRLRGDLSTILATALARDPARRYTSVAAIATDIRRYLEDRPIVARPSRAVYLLWKFARRHRTIVSVATLSVMLLVAVAVVASLQAVRATRAELDVRLRTVALEHALAVAEDARSTAEQNEGQAREVTGFLKEMLHSVSPEQLGRGRALEDMLAEAGRRLASTLADQPLTRADLHETIASAYASLGAYDNSAPYSREALRLYETHGARWSAGWFRSAALAARIELHTGDIQDAADRLRTLHAESLRELGATHRETRAILFARIEAEARSGAFRRARELLNTVLQSDDRGGDAPKYLVHALVQLGRVHRLEKRLPEAQELFATAVDTARDRFGAEDPRTLAALRGLAKTLAEAGDVAVAEPMLVEALEVSRARHGADRPVTLDLMTALGEVRWEYGRYADAREVLTESLAMHRDVRGVRHWRTQRTMVLLGRVFRDQGRFDEALSLFDELLQVRTETRRADHPSIQRVRVHIATVLCRQGRLDEAQALCESAYAQIVAYFGHGHPDTIWYAKTLADWYRLSGELDAARDLAQAALIDCIEARGVERPLTHSLQHCLALIERDRGGVVEAERLMRNAFEARQAMQGPCARQTRASRKALTALLRLRGAAKDADVQIVAEPCAAPQSPAAGEFRCELLESE